MKVKDWFNSGKDYQKGIVLYSGLKGAKPNLIRLFYKKQSVTNEEKLTYELSKYLEENEVEEVKVDQELKKVEEVKMYSTTQFFFRLNQLPIQLHEKARYQRDIFQKAISLKLELNALHEIEEVKALKICLEIENIFDKINAIQNILQHYVTHKVVLDVSPPNFKQLTPAQLLQRRNNKRSSLTKQKTRITKLNEELKKDLTLSVKNSKLKALEKAEAKVIALENDIVTLNGLINKK